MEKRSAADVDGPLVDTPGLETGLVLRCKKHWTTPIVELSNAMLATFLRQRIALRLVVPEAQKRLDAATYCKALWNNACQPEPMADQTESDTSDAGSSLTTDEAEWCGTKITRELLLSRLK